MNQQRFWVPHVNGNSPTNLAENWNGPFSAYVSRGSCQKLLATPNAGVRLQRVHVTTAECDAVGVLLCRLIAA